MPKIIELMQHALEVPDWISQARNQFKELQKALESNPETRKPRAQRLLTLLNHLYFGIDYKDRPNLANDLHAVLVVYSENDCDDHAVLSESDKKWVAQWWGHIRHFLRRYTDPIPEVQSPVVTIPGTASHPATTHKLPRQPIAALDCGTRMNTSK